MALTEQQKQEIKEQQSHQNTTKRVTVANLEKILYEAIPILDHGFIRVVDYMGDDSSIVQAARVSYGKGTKKVSTDEGLIRYLLRHWHSTPFEMCEIKYHIKLPIFIARQWIRHRTANVNEYSARYSILDKEFYIPAPDKLAAQAVNNRQGRGDLLEGEQAQEVLNILKEDSQRTYENYENMLNERYDGSTIETLKKWVPITHSAFLDYRVGAAHISAKGLNIIKSMLSGGKVDLESSGLSKREWNELMQVLDKKDLIT